MIISRVRGYHGTNYGGTSAQGLPLNKEGYGELLAPYLADSSLDMLDKWFDQSPSFPA